MRRWKKVVVGLVALVVGIPLLFVASMYASAWYHQWRALQLLAVVKNVTPGVTTQADYLRAVAPFNNGELKMLDSDNKPMPYNGAIGISNWLALSETEAQCMSVLAERYFIGHLVPVEVDFVVIPTYGSGLLSELEIRESMAANGHPPGATVRWSARRFEAGDSWLANTSSGYWVSHMGVTDQEPWEVFVEMDERATSVERDRALDFQFRCFVKSTGCSEGREYLQPAPNRPGSEAGL